MQKPHPADPRCCGIEYMREWDSACLLAFDEIKESACVAAGKVGRNEIQDHKNNSVICNRVWNAIAGFCESNGLPSPELVPGTGIAMNKNSEHYEPSFDKRIYVIIVPRGEENPWNWVRGDAILEATPYDIFIGYAAYTLRFQDYLAVKPET